MICQADGIPRGGDQIALFHVLQEAVEESAMQGDAAAVAQLLAVAALSIALMQGAEWGWGAPPTLALFWGGVALLVLFSVIETRRARSLIDVDLLRGQLFLQRFNAGL